ncbi:MAG: hypothetical protein N4A65_00370 [Cohaesibacter sp.]|jgi:hypothetical protein|nr:hypothetical protein [Cohaesibacter sp.]
MAKRSLARHYHHSMVHYLRATITFADDAKKLEIGKIPEDSILVDAGVVVTTAFNDTGTDQIDIGTEADPDGIATDLDVSAVGLKAADELATSDDLYATSGDLTLVAQYDGANSDATAGKAVVFVAYLPNNG